MWNGWINRVTELLAGKRPVDAPTMPLPDPLRLPQSEQSHLANDFAANHFTGLRIGAVSYLNSKPLVDRLAVAFPGANIRLDFPSKLADALEAGELDVALIPSIEYLRHPGYEIVSEACIATHGPVLSVKLYTRVPFDKIQTLALDEGSRTSAALAQILLAERYGIHPETVPLPMRAGTGDTNADAILLIGDRAMFPAAEEFYAAWDLGEEWSRQTGLPFVFAMWVARPDLFVNKPWTVGTVAAGLNAARDGGLAAIPQIVSAAATLYGLPAALVQHYLTKNLYFKLGTNELAGLSQYFRLAARNHLVPDGVSADVRFTAATAE